MESQSEPESQRFIPQSDDDKNVFPALAITAEKGKKFKVRKILSSSDARLFRSAFQYLIGALGWHRPSDKQTLA